MKQSVIYLYAVTCAVLTLGSCKENDETTPSLNIAPTTIPTLSANADTVSMAVTSNSAWTLTNSATWCTPSALSGTGNYAMHLFVDENIGQSSRSTTLKFALPTSTTGTSITVTQAAPTASADYHYKLPVIPCHLFRSK